MATVYEIEQRIAASSQFNGAAPELSGDALAASDDDGKRIFVDAAGAQVGGDAGGLFVFPFAASAILWKVERVLISGGDTTFTYTISVAAADGTTDAVEVATGGAGSESYLHEDLVTLGRDDTLVIVTASATTALKAKVIARPILHIPS